MDMNLRILRIQQQIRKCESFYQEEENITFFFTFICNALFASSISVSKQIIPEKINAWKEFLGPFISAYAPTIFTLGSFFLSYAVKRYFRYRGDQILGKISLNDLIEYTNHETHTLDEKLLLRKIRLMKKNSSSWLADVEREFFGDELLSDSFRGKLFDVYDIVTKEIQPTIIQQFLITLGLKQKPYMTLKMRLSFLTIAIQQADIKAQKKIIHHMISDMSLLEHEIQSTNAEEFDDIIREIKTQKQDHLASLLTHLKENNKAKLQKITERPKYFRYLQVILYIQGWFSLNVIGSASDVNYQIHAKIFQAYKGILPLLVSLALPFFSIIIAGAAICLAILVNRLCVLGVSALLKKEDPLSLALMHHHDPASVPKALLKQKFAEMSAKEWNVLRTKLKDSNEGSLVIDDLFNKYLVAQYKKSAKKSKPSFINSFYNMFKTNALNRIFWSEKASIPPSLLIDYIEILVKQNRLKDLIKYQQSLLRSHWPNNLSKQDLERLRLLNSSLDQHSPYKKTLDLLMKTENDPFIQQMRQDRLSYKAIVRYEKAKKMLDNLFFPFNSFSTATLSGLYFLAPAIFLGSAVPFTLIPVVVLTLSLMLLATIKYVITKTTEKKIQEMKLTSILLQGNNKSIYKVILDKKAACMKEHDWKEFVNEIVSAKNEAYNNDYIAKTAFDLLNKHAPQYLTSCREYFESAALKTENLSLLHQVRDYYEIKDEGQNLHPMVLSSKELFFDFTSSEMKALKSLVHLIKTTLNKDDKKINILRHSFRSWFSERENEEGFHFKLEVKGKKIILELSKINEELLTIVFESIQRDFKGRDFSINIVSISAEEEKHHRKIFDDFLTSSKNKHDHALKKPAQQAADSLPHKIVLRK
ncbi:hypothetical protein EBR43_02480 [bacterium]|nr:hypothetical protein [bacterium]